MKIKFEYRASGLLCDPSFQLVPVRRRAAFVVRIANFCNGSWKPACTRRQGTASNGINLSLVIRASFHYFWHCKTPRLKQREVKRSYRHLTGVIQPYRSGTSPRMMPKNWSWIVFVTSPREPLPTLILSTERTGVTSTAVPVKKISSAT